MVALVPQRRERLTGRVRGRPQFFGCKLVMQVEVSVEQANGPFAGNRMPKPTHADAAEWAAKEDRRIATEVWNLVATEWRDATWEDQLRLVESGALQWTST